MHDGRPELSTIQSSGLGNTNQISMNGSRASAEEIQWFFQESNLGDEDTALVVGLGNWNATPDSLGPKVLENLMVTRHLLELSPPELRQGLRPVAALAPGVLGLTGIETGEIIMGVVSRIGAKAVICIDALASRSVDRLCSTIQISDTGINPGAGVGNRRLAINRETLGIPVIALGVPTVVHAVTIISDALNLWRATDSERLTSACRVPDRSPGITRRNPAPKANPSVDRRQLMSQVLDPYFGSMIVTPKEIDLLIDEVADVVTGALNIAFHEGVSYDEVFKYLS